MHLDPIPLRRSDLRRHLAPVVPPEYDLLHIGVDLPMAVEVPLAPPVNRPVFGRSDSPSKLYAVLSWIGPPAMGEGFEGRA